jgi:probable HAF family extracellular repeat protein
MNSRSFSYLVTMILIATVSVVAAAQCTRCGPGLTVSPHSLSFPPQVVGTTSAAMTVTLRSVGIFPVTFNGIVSSGPPLFETNNCPHSLPRNATCRIRVTFAPTAIGTFDGTITSSDYAGKQVVTLSGTGVAAGAIIPATPSLDEQPLSQLDAPQHHRYKLLDLGTFGGPQSYVNIPDTSYARVLNNRGMVAGWADTPLPDPYPDFCFDGDCLVAHAFRWQRGIRSDLGVLPGGASSQGNWVSSNGLIAGISQNGEIDPLVPGFPEFRAVLWRNREIIDLGTIGGGYESIATSVNSRGQVVGFATNTIPDPDSMFGLGFQTRAFLWQDGAMQDLGTLGTGTNAMAMLINEKGQIAGNSYTSAEPSSLCAEEGLGSLTTGTFLWNQGSLLDLGNFGGSCTFASDLNNRGQVVGGSRLAGDLEQHPFLWNGKKLIDLGTFGGSLGTAIALNDAGDTVGWATYPGDEVLHAALWRHGKMEDLGALAGDAFTQGFDINERGQVVGISTNDFLDLSQYRAFLWQPGGSMLDLNGLVSGSGLQLALPETISDHGEIAGIALDADGNQHAFLLVPCDENHTGTEGCGDATDGTTALQNTPAGVSNRATTSTQQRLAPSGTTGWLARAPHRHRLPRLVAQTAAQAEPAPTNLSSYAFKRGLYDVVLLSWINHSNDADSNHMERCTGSTCTDFREIAVIGGNATRYIDWMWPMHLTFRYRLRAHGPNGYSAYSNIRTQSTP